MKQIRKRLTYANVMSSIAVFLLLGGATAYAALGKNTVGSKQLKKNSVTSAKIKKGAVTGAKINLSTLGTVPSATTATNAANATNAKHADSATSADNATNAKTLGGQEAGAFQQRVRWALVGTSGTIVAQSGGITNTHDPGSCPTGCDFLDFGSSQQNKAIVITSSFGAVVGDTYRTGICGGGVSEGSTSCSVGNDHNHVLVRSFDSANAATDSSYWVAVIG